MESDVQGWTRGGFAKLIGNGGVIHLIEPPRDGTRPIKRDCSRAIQWATRVQG